MSFWAEIRRRKVFQVAAAYAVVAWLLIEIVSTIEAPLNLPGWFDTFVIVVLAIGFPVALVLSWAFDLTPDGVASAGGSRDTASGRRSAGVFANLTQLLILAAVGFLVADEYLFGTDVGESPEALPASAGFVNRFSHTITVDQPAENNRWNVFTFAPNGRRFAYHSNVGIYLRDLDTLETRLLPGSGNIFANPFFSPDGRFLAYSSTRGELVRLSVDDNTPTTIVSGLTVVNSGSWADDDTIFYSLQGDIYRVSAEGGVPELIVPRDEGYVGQDSPRLLPDGDSLVFSRRRFGTGWDEAEIVLRSLSTGEQKVLLTGGSDARYVETGHLVYAIGDSLLGVGFDLETRTVRGAPRELVSGLTRALALGSANYGVARDGTLAYLGRLGEPIRTLVWVNRDGTETEIPMQPGNYWYAQLSPDDSMAALNGWNRTGRHVWIHEFGRQLTRQLTFDLQQPAAPIWSPDQRVVYGVGVTVARHADGSGVPEVLAANDETGTVPYAFTPDGRTLLRGNTDPPRRTWAVSLGADSSEQSRLILSSSGSAYNATISPDGRWVAYQSDETGRLEVYVRAFPEVDAGGKWSISTGGGMMPLWSRDPASPELFFLEPSASNPGNFTAMRVAIDADSDTAFRHGPPQPLFERRLRLPFSQFRSPWDISRDGTRFLMIKDAPQQDAITSTSEVVIVQNWLQELRTLVPR